MGKSLSAYDLTNNQVNPPDDPSRLVGTVLDFPDAAGTREFSAVKPDSVYGVYWARFQVASFGDANVDGNVNLDDFNTLASNFGRTAANWQQGDFTGDGLVNLNDFNLLAAHFGVSAAPNGPAAQDWHTLGAMVPEPAFPLLTILPAAALLLRRRAGACAASEP